MIPIQAGQFPAGEVPEVINLPPAAAETFKKGRILTRSGATVAAHALGATVTGVFGVAQSPADNGVAAGVGGKVNVAKANRTTKFIGQVYNSTDANGSGAAGIVDVSDALIGDQYGLIVVDGDTYVDEEDVTNVLVEITDIKVDLNIVVFIFLESTLQEGA